MSKHTPGPWGLVYYAKGAHLPIPIGEHKTIAVFADGPQRGDVAYMQHGLYGDDQALATARLIAAAPDMLAALRKAVLALAHASETAPGLYVEAYEEVSAAITEATGESA